MTSSLSPFGDNGDNHARHLFSPNYTSGIISGALIPLTNLFLLITL